MTYEEIIKKAGKQIKREIYYFDENEEKVNVIEDNIKTIKISFNSSIVGTVMKGIELELKEELPNTAIYVKITAKYGNESAYKLYGAYYLKEKASYSADSKTYTHNLYDSMMKTMVDYNEIVMTYPTTIENYFKKLVETLGMTTNVSNLINGNLPMNSDIYVGINYTYRDVLDDIAKANGILLQVDGNEIKLCEFNDNNVAEINDDILKNTNIDFGEHYGVINSIVLSRSAESDSVFLQDEESINENGLCEFKISDNQLMNDNNRSDFLPALLNKLEGIEFDLFDTELIGYGGFDPLQKVVFTTNNKTYTSYVFNNEITITDGYEETIYTDLPTESTTDYSASDLTDKKINQTNLIVRKQEQEIQSLISTSNETQTQLSQVTQNVQNIQNLFQITGGNNLIKNSVGLFGKEYWEEEKYVTKNILEIPDGSYSSNGITATSNKGEISVSGTSTSSTSFVKIPINIPLDGNYRLSLNTTPIQSSTTTELVRLEDANSSVLGSACYISSESSPIAVNNKIAKYLTIRTSANKTINYTIKPQLEVGNIATEYVPFNYDNGTYEYGEDSSLIGTTTSASRIVIGNGILKTNNDNIIGLTLTDIKSLSFKIKQDADTTTKITLYSDETKPLYERTFDEEISDYREIYEEANKFYTNSSNLTLKIESIGQYGGKVYISDLILNNGEKTNWQPAVSEIWGTVIKLSQLGITVYSVDGNYATLMTSQGVQVRYLVNNEIGDIITQFTKNGIETIDIEQKGKHIQNNLVSDCLNLNGSEIYVRYIR